MESDQVRPHFSLFRLPLRTLTFCFSSEPSMISVQALSDTISALFILEFYQAVRLSDGDKLAEKPFRKITPLLTDDINPYVPNRDTENAKRRPHL